MAVQRPEQSFVLVNSSNTSGPKDLLNAASSETHSSIYSIAESINIKRNFMVPYPVKARVLRSFYIGVQFIESEFVATSALSDVYEVGETFPQAVLNYLYSLVDELIWLDEHKQSLSPSMFNSLEKLKNYLRLV